VKLHPDSREFIELLTSHGVERVLVGGHAVAYHGYPRFTGDIDFFFRPTVENARRLRSALDEFGFTQLELTPEQLIEPGRVVQLGRPPNRIDLLSTISGVDFDTVWTGRIEGQVDGLTVDIIGLGELLQNKRASGRLKDLADLEELEGD